MGIGGYGAIALCLLYRVYLLIGVMGHTLDTLRKFLLDILYV